jgi:hypothetical protein
LAIDGRSEVIEENKWQIAVDNYGFDTIHLETATQSNHQQQERRETKITMKQRNSPSKGER